ncbi:MAG: hypothetical protein R2874_15780 [Desulfobacterales bacterium]
MADFYRDHHHAGPGADNPGRPPATLRAAVVDPLIEYFTRPGALWVLALFCFTKVRDSMATTMTIPFYLDIGYTNTEIGSSQALPDSGPPFSAHLPAGS